MNANIRMEEVTAIGDFLFTSYNRDFNVIKGKFTKMDATFRDGFVAKLDFVKELESTLLLSEGRKKVTENLYAEAKSLNEELNFLSIYFTDAALDAAIVSALKHDLFVHNIEGALLKITALKQYILANEAALIEQGMDSDFMDVLANYKVSLTQKNKLQNDLINDRKKLTDANQSHYDALLKMIRKINRTGKTVFKGTVTQDEYTMVKIVQRMRAAPPKKEVPSKE